MVRVGVGSRKGKWEEEEEEEEADLLPPPLRYVFWRLSSPTGYNIIYHALKTLLY
jgi:hypothetical protein